jgi:hypothetical protein
VLFVEMNICNFTHFLTGNHIHIFYEEVELGVEYGRLLAVLYHHPILENLTIKTEILSCSIEDLVLEDLTPEFGVRVKLRYQRGRRRGRVRRVDILIRLYYITFRLRTVEPADYRPVTGSPVTSRSKSGSGIASQVGWGCTNYSIGFIGNKHRPPASAGLVIVVSINGGLPITTTIVLYVYGRSNGYYI